MEHLVQTRHAGGLTGARSVARVVIALSLVCAMGGALGQGVGFQSMPEFEAWIAEAEKGNKDPVDWALDNTGLVASYARLLTIFESLKTRNSKSITSVEIEKIRSIYNDTVTPPEMRRRIELQFGSKIGESFRR